MKRLLRYLLLPLLALGTLALLPACSDDSSTAQTEEKEQPLQSLAGTNFVGRAWGHLVADGNSAEVFVIFEGFVFEESTGICALIDTYFNNGDHTTATSYEYIPLDGILSKLTITTQYGTYELSFAPLLKSLVSTTGQSIHITGTLRDTYGDVYEFEGDYVVTKE